MQICALDGKDNLLKLLPYTGFGYIKTFAFSLVKTNSDQALCLISKLSIA